MYTEQSLELISAIMSGADRTGYLSEDLLLAHPGQFQSSVPVSAFYDSTAFKASVQQAKKLRLDHVGLSPSPEIATTTPLCAAPPLYADGDMAASNDVVADEISAPIESAQQEFVDPWMQQAALLDSETDMVGDYNDLNKALGAFAKGLPDVTPNASPITAAADRYDDDRAEFAEPISAMSTERHSLPDFMALDDSETSRAALTPEAAAIKMALQAQGSDKLANMMSAGQAKTDMPAAPAKPAGLMPQRALSELERALLEQGSDNLAQHLKQEQANLPSQTAAPADDSPEIVAAAEDVLRRILAAETDMPVAAKSAKSPNGLSLVHSQEKAPLVPGLPETADLSAQISSDSFNGWGPAPELDMTLEDTAQHNPQMMPSSPAPMQPAGKKTSIQNALARLIENNPIPAQPRAKGTDPFPA